MQKKRGLLAVSLFGFGAAALICSVSVAAAAQTVDGYEYKIHSAVVEAEELGKFPPDYPDAITRHFRQGPRHTLMWGDLVEERTPDNASFARGERRLGLLIPHWPAERRATQDTGWDSYGEPLVYNSFASSVERGDDDRTIAGHAARHYVFKADFSVRRENEAASIQQKIVSQLWIVPELPFSWAPYAVLGIYADPRLGAAILHQVGELGMVVRVDTGYEEKTILEDGSLAGTPRQRAHVGWVTDLQPTAVPQLDVPVADEATFERLSVALGDDREDICQMVADGEIPAAANKVLTAKQQPAVLQALREVCARP
ncbi:MAG TPA: hypothetical protein VK110_02395 [Salinisphaeraceae bacterium]|nr:hypothetical protein [Salinisphaeraceae bacterium]